MPPGAPSRTPARWARPEQGDRRLSGAGPPAVDNPLPLADGRSLSFNDADTGTNQALYSRATGSRCPMRSPTSSKGDGAALMALADAMTAGMPGSLQRRTRRLPGDRLCGRFEHGRPGPGSTNTRQDHGGGPVAGIPATHPRGVKDPCAYWPVPPTSTAHVPQVEGLPRVLVISTTHDPATPYEAGVNLGEALGAALLTVEGTTTPPTWAGQQMRGQHRHQLPDRPDATGRRHHLPLAGVVRGFVVRAVRRPPRHRCVRSLHRSDSAAKAVVQVFPAAHQGRCPTHFWSDTHRPMSPRKCARNRSCSCAG